MGLVLVIGGARSGKSRFAEQLAARAGERVLYVATAKRTTHDGAIDEEMVDRIERHRGDRPAGWVTLEEPTDVIGALTEWLQHNEPPDAILLDCLTLLLTNWLLGDGGETAVEDDVLERVEQLAEYLDGLPFPAIVVSNETGSGIVPMSSLGRLFRDVSGFANQRVAAGAREVYAAVAGIPVEIKALDARLNWRDS